jgi:hypothetical protein
MAALGAEIQALNADTNQLIQQRNQLNFSKPKPLAKDATAEARAQHEQAMRAWQKESESLAMQAQRLDAKAVEHSKKLDRLAASANANQKEQVAAHRKTLEVIRRKLAASGAPAGAPAGASSGKPAAKSTKP